MRADRTPAEARRRPNPAVPAPAVVQTALTTPDRRWQVDVIERDGLASYRLLHADNVIEGLDLPTVQRILDQAGVDLGDLVEVTPDAATHRRSGAA